MPRLISRIACAEAWPCARLSFGREGHCEQVQGLGRYRPALARLCGIVPAYPPTPQYSHGRQAGLQACASAMAAQMLSLSALTGKAFTILREGFAFTMTTLPKISRLPAFVAGLVRVFNLQIPGMVNTPVFLVSFCPM